MKKTASLMLVALIVSACAAPQVTVAPEVTVTLTSTPMPTPHPEFAALQQAFSDSGLRFTLQADGLIYDGETPVPGLHVTPDGTMTLTVDGESVTLGPVDVVFDDEDGVSIDGYEQDENGAWVEASETVTLGGVTLTLDENGVVTDMSVEGNYTPEQKTEKLKAVDPTNWGFDKGEAQIVVDGSDRFITPVGDPETKIAKWYFASNEWEWDLDVMKGLEGGNPLFDFAETWEMNGKSPVDSSSAHTDSVDLLNFANQSGPGIHYTYIVGVYLFSDDHPGVAVAAVAGTNSSLFPDSTENTKKMVGWICLKNDSGELVRMRVRNAEVVRRRFH